MLHAIRVSSLYLSLKVLTVFGWTTWDRIGRLVLSQTEDNQYPGDAGAPSFQFGVAYRTRAKPVVV